MSMTRVMRDSTTLTDIPRRGLDVVAAYINGAFSSTPAEVHARFGKRPVAWIDVNGSESKADVLDVEVGDATPAASVGWAKAHRASHPGGYPPIIYCNRATLTAVFNAMSAGGLHIGSGFRLWIATLDGTKRVADMTGVWAVQYAGEAQTGGHYDESIVYDDGWKAAAPPVIVPPIVTGPHRHVTSGGETLGEIAVARNTSVAHLLETSCGSWTDADKAAIGGLKLPAGFVFYTSN